MTGGEIVVTLKYGKIPVFSKTVQLCDQAKEMGFPCPLAAKTYDDVEMSVELPGFIPGVSQDFPTLYMYSISFIVLYHSL